MTTTKGRTMMKRLALLGLGAVLGAAMGALGLLTGQRSGFLSLPTTPGDPWEKAPDAGLAVEPTAAATPADIPDARNAPEAPMGVVSTAVSNKEPSAPAEELHPEPVRYLTVGEVAELLGTTSAALSKTADLPEPDAIVGRTRGWLETTITSVLEDRAEA